MPRRVRNQTERKIFVLPKSTVQFIDEYAEKHDLYPYQVITQAMEILRKQEEKVRGSVA